MANAEDHTESNRKFWDQQAGNYSSKPWQIKTQQQIFNEIRSQLDFIGVPWLDREVTADQGKDVHLLDYACGTGLVSRALAPYISATTGIDISQGMVAKFNDAFDSGPESPADTKAECTGQAVVGDLLSDPPSTSVQHKMLGEFDIAAIGLGFHHFADPRSAIGRLVQCVKPGSGVVLVIDWLPDADGGHGHRHGAHGHSHEQIAAGAQSEPAAFKTIKTNGFSEDDMRQYFEAAGCTDFRFHVMKERLELWIGEEHNKRKMVKTAFLARGQRRS